MQEFLNFIGTVKDKTFTHVGSPIQLDFPSTSHETSVPAQITPWNATIPSCYDSALLCSCGDCPDAPSCSDLPSSASTAHQGACTVGKVGSWPVLCIDVVVCPLGLLLLAGLIYMFLRGQLASESEDSVFPSLFTPCNFPSVIKIGQCWP
jgi:Niemann-Pick C1 protein